MHSTRMPRGLPALLLLLLAAAALLAGGTSAAHGGRDDRGGRGDRGRGGPSACLLMGADLAACPGNNTLTCENSAGDVVCVHSRNLTSCPEPADLDEVERECREPKLLGCLLPDNATKCAGNRTLPCQNSVGNIVCVPALNTTECLEPAALDGVDRECRDCNRSSSDSEDDSAKDAGAEEDDNAGRPNRPDSGRRMLGAPDGNSLRDLDDRLRAEVRQATSCLLADASECPGDRSLTCENSAGDVVCVPALNTTECPEPVELDTVDRECREPKPLGCLLPENATECAGDRSLTCENSAGDVVCVTALNTAECPEPVELDTVDRECREPKPLGCLLPENATECAGDRSLTCENSAGDVVCVTALNTAECPEPAELDTVDRECREPKPLGCLLPENATECPSERSLTCENSAGDVVCVLALNSTDCPEPANLDEVHRECHEPKLLGCLLPEKATDCPGSRALSCQNSNGDIVCVRPLADDAACPDAAELDAVTAVCRDGTRPSGDSAGADNGRRQPGGDGEPRLDGRGMLGAFVPGRRMRML